MDKEEKEKVRFSRFRRVLILSAVLLAGGVGLLYFRYFQVCGYKLGGFEIECDCNGKIVKRQDNKGLVSKEGELFYCLGKANTKVCIKKFGSDFPGKPYLCSSYDQEARIIPASGLSVRKLYPDSNFAYLAEIAGESVVLETKEEVDCERVEVQGFTEMIKMSGYQGFHLYAAKFRCIE